MAKVKAIIDNLLNDVESDEHAYVVSCLKAAVKYCQEQYLDNGGEVDPLPSITKLGLHDEGDKFILIDYFLKRL